MRGLVTSQSHLVEKVPRGLKFSLPWVIKIDVAEEMFAPLVCNIRWDKRTKGFSMGTARVCQFVRAILSETVCLPR